MTYLTSEQQLREVFGFAKGRAKEKCLTQLEQHSINFINLSAFMTMSTFDRQGRVDCSPRGGEKGFVKVVSHNSFIIPEAKGNNRLDSLVNILSSGRIGCLFLVAGVDETLRINGSAKISVDEGHLALFSELKNPPKACIEVQVEEVFLHCAKALMRARLWHEGSQIIRSDFPTMGEMLKAQLSLEEPVESQQQMLARYQNDL